jgi:flagellar motor protein MotB
MNNKKNRPVKALVDAKTIAEYRSPLIVCIFFVAISSLAGCSFVPNTINPAVWYQNTLDLLAGEDGPEQERGMQTDKAKRLPGEKSVVPNLSSVPKRPPLPVVRGLVPDLQKRKYAQPIARQGEATQLLAQQAPPPAPQSGQAPAVTALQKAPSAMPASPVTSAPKAQSIPTRPAVTYSSIQPKSFTLTPPTASVGFLPPKTLASIADDPYTTVVVSSNGVSIKSTSAAAAALTQAQQMASISPVFASGLQQSKALSVTKVATILFKTGSSGLSGNDRKIIGQVVRLHQQRGGLVTVVGHASSRTRDMDPVSHKKVNYGVSVNRANKIAKELRKLGLAPESIIVDARSDSMPIYYEIMPSGEAGNRRAEIYFNN